MKKFNLLILLALCPIFNLTVPASISNAAATDVAVNVPETVAIEPSSPPAAAPSVSAPNAPATEVTPENSVSSDNKISVEQVEKLPDPTKALRPDSPRYVLRGIAKNSSTTFCVINESILQEGEQIDELKVVRITHDYVLLIDENQNHLKLKLY
jgi:hypothetical protein